MPDPIKKYKAPNGKVVSETTLKEKYGERYNSLISDGTFSTIDEPIYETPNGSYEVESVLKEKYGDRFNDLVSKNTFKLDEPLKKKDFAESTSQNQELATGQEAESGSLDGTEVKDNSDVELYEKYQQAKQLTEEQSLEIDKEIESNTLTNKRYSKMKDNWFFRTTGIANSSAFEPKEVDREKLEKEAIKRNQEEFFENISKEDQTSLQKQELAKIKNLNTENKARIFDNNNYAEQRKSIQKEINNISNGIMASVGREDREPTQAAYDRLNELEALDKELVGKMNTNIQEYESSQEDLQGFNEELELFKKNWDLWDAAGKNIGLQGAKGVLSIAKVVNDYSPIKGLIPESKQEDVDDAINKGVDIVEEEQSILRPSKSVEDIKSLEDFGEFFVETIGEQAIPMYAAATGVGGVSYLGASSFGGKKLDLEREIKFDGKNYSKEQILLASSSSALFDTAGALVDRYAMLKGARALKAGINSGGKKAIEKGVMKYIKPVAAEFTEETAALLGEQIVDYYALDKKDTKIGADIANTLAKTGLTVGLMNTLPTLAGETMGVYHNRKKKSRVKENLKVIEGLQSQLDNGTNLSKEETSAITSSINKAVKENMTILKNTADLINNLTDEERYQVAELDKKIKEKQSAAKKVNESENINPEAKEKLAEESKQELDELESKKEEIVNKKIDAKEEKNTKEAEEPKVEEATSESETNTKETEVNLPQTQKTDEAAQEQNTTTNEDVRLGADTNIQQGQESSVQPTFEPKTSSNETKVNTPVVKKVKSHKGATYDVEFNEEGNVSAIYNKKGKKIEKFVLGKNGKPKRNSNYTKIESDALGVKTENQLKKERKQNVQLALDENTPTTAYEYALDALAKGENINLEDASNETGYSKDELKWVSGFKKDKDLPRLETVAERIVESADVDLDVQDVRNALIEILQQKSSKFEIEEDILNQYKEKQNQQEEAEMAAFKNGLSEKDLAAFESIEAEEDFFSELTDNEIVEYLEEQYGKQETENEQNGETETKSVQEPSRKETKKPTKEERKQIVFDKVDNIAELLKDALPGIKDDDIDTNGITQDKLIDLMAKSVKHLISTGIDIDEAVRQVVKSIKDKLNVDIDPEEVKSKVSTNTTTAKTPPKKEGEGFKKKPNEKALLSRVSKGGNNLSIKEEVDKYGLNYESENQKEARKKAISFVKKVGVDNAVKALRDNLLKGAEKAFVYGEVLDQLTLQIESANKENIPSLEEKYANILASITNEFDIEGREYGRFISALNLIYNSSILKYDLTRQLDKYKAKNNGEVPDNVLEKFTEASEQLKELEKKIEEAEAKLEKAEAQDVIDDISESENQENKNKAKNRKKAKALATKIRSVKIHKKGIFSSASPASLAFDTAIEVVAKSVETGGSVADAIQEGIAYIKKTDWYKGLSKSKQKEAENTFSESIEEGLSGPIDVTVEEDENGIKTISITKDTLLNFIKQGIKDIDVISQKILDEISNEHPELTLRDVRDAISGYGKQQNLNKDEVEVEFRKLKRWGKLISAEEDVNQGKRPKRSGVKRDKPSREEAKKKREINEILRDFPVDESALEEQWKNALDSVKSRLRNQISDLITQIKNEEKSKSERNPIEYDKRAKELKETRDRLKEQLEELVGKTELTTEQKVKRAEKSLENNIEKLRENIAKGNIEYKKKPDTLNSNKLKKLREEQSKLREELNDLREKTGIIEKRRLSLRKKAVVKRTKELELKIKNKEYSTKKKKPLKEDLELRKLKAEQIRVQEIFNTEQYKAELKNRTALRKFRDAMVNVFGIPRIVLATGEASFVFIQGGIQTISLLTRNPLKLAKTFKEAFLALGSDTKAKEFEFLMQTHPKYESMKNNRVSLTKTDYKLEAKEETFQGDYLSAVWDLIGKGIDISTGNKKYTTIGDTILKLIGKENKNAKKITAGKQFKNINPIRAIERANTVYMNNLRMHRYLDGMDMLKAEGKNEIDHAEDYKRLAKAINSLTGRADIGRLEGVSDILNTVFFSFRNTVSTFNQLNPVWYAVSLRDSTGFKKASVAQKIALRDMIRFVSITGSFMALVQAAGGKDEDDEWNIEIETDARSSDFMKLKIGNARFDPWHGLTQLVVLYSRIISDSTMTSKGQIKTIGKGYKEDTAWDISFRTLVTNKFSPSAAMAYRRLNTNVDKLGDRVTPFGEEYSFTEELKQLYPIYWQGLQEIKEEDPDLLTGFLTTLGFFGLNSQVYGNEKETYNPIQKDNLD